MKVGDLVKLPHNPVYWWGGQVGIIDLVEPEGSSCVKYRVRVPGKGSARFGDMTFVEVLNESR
ncbi:MAG: hypothetical protein CMA72_09105 [Euryarchaeota archaeon]|nr:hypothetical protein [Euryarchaeota archaeon]